jgi:hypothetical protein
MPIDIRLHQLGPAKGNQIMQTTESPSKHDVTRLLRTTRSTLGHELGSEIKMHFFIVLLLYKKKTSRL